MIDWYSFLSPIFSEQYAIFFIRKVFIRKWASKTQNLKKILRKSLASNAWVAIFWKLWFFLELFKSYKIEKILAFFLFKVLLKISIIKKMMLIVIVKPNKIKN